MKECRSYAAKKAAESHMRNGTYPPKGVYSANLQKGRPYMFKAPSRTPEQRNETETKKIKNKKHA